MTFMISIQLGMIMPRDIFSEGLKPPTRQDMNLITKKNKHMISSIQVHIFLWRCLYGGVLKCGYLHIIHNRRIVHGINHPAIAITPFLETSIELDCWV